MLRSLSIFVALSMLAFTVVHRSAESVHGQLLSWGEGMWPGYADLRTDRPRPACDAPTDGSQGLPRERPADGSLDAMFAELDGQQQGDAPSTLDAMFAELDGQQQGDAPSTLDAMFAELDGEKQGGDTPAAAVALQTRDPDPTKAAHEACLFRQEAHDAQQERLTPPLRAYRAVEKATGELNGAGRKATPYLLVSLLMLCGVLATSRSAHIAMRGASSRFAFRVSAILQALANLMLMASALAHEASLTASGLLLQSPHLPLVWALGFAAMAARNLHTLRHPDPELERGGTWAEGLAATPLYTWMALIAGAWFLIGESHPTGLAIYLDKLTEHASLYIQVGLYVWAGMLLKQSRLPEGVFSVLRPFRMPPELLTVVLVLLAALPTAYSGASGIFVIAVGGLLYRELRQAGAREQLALAATAMSGSMGVVLAPCLLVVIVASLNKQVTTTELFSAGTGVFALTAGLFAAMAWLTRTSKWSLAPLSEALPASARAARRLFAPLALGITAIVLSGTVLGEWLDEHNAPRIILIALLLILWWEGRQEGSGLSRPVARATSETTEHIGALLILMALSVALGGIVERAGVMEMVPTDLGSPFAAMSLLAIALVAVGMVMDPYGAVILVSATLTKVAYANGIAPLHFWMVVLVAFELGYLTPPVALNHLLTRTVVDDLEHAPPTGDAHLAGASWYRRHERLVLPMTVMGTALLLVAYVPLFWSP